ncbi:MAG: DNA recombination protein RmuC [Christensenella sp.]
MRLFVTSIWYDKIADKGMEVRKMEIIIIAGIAILAVLCIIIIVRQNAKTSDAAALRTELAQQFNILSGMVLDTVGKATTANNGSVELLRHTVEEKLAEIRFSVDQKLETTLKSGLNSSFARVSEQLEQVYKSMGEVRALTSGIGDLKSILSGVKTRGIWGEAQLHKLLSDFLAPGQFIENAVIGGSGAVEFAVRMPREDGADVLLPIDSKFPMDRYSKVLSLGESGEAAALMSAQKEFVQAVITEAKKISEKYIAPPQTTDFAIMFLPSEGLYSEVIRLGLADRLQSKYRVMVTGPTTLCAFLTSLQTGFRTFSIQQHSAAIIDMLSGIKSEFETFADMLQKTQNSLNAAQNHLESVQKRSIRISTKLSDVEFKGDE